MIALLGNLARDRFPGAPPRTGGAPYHAARALAHLEIPCAIYARCGVADRQVLFPALTTLQVAAHFVPGTATASFAISDAGARREMEVLAIGDVWATTDLPVLDQAIEWVHVAPLLRSDFPAGTLARLGSGRRLSLDGQGLVRPARLGPLRLDENYDPAMLDHVQVLKLSDEEADVLGALERLPVPELIVTHGASGATLRADGRIEEIPAVAVGGNHTGTGDAFSIAYVAARSSGLEPAAAARSASALVTTMLSAA